MNVMWHVAQLEKKQRNWQTGLRPICETGFLCKCSQMGLSHLKIIHIANGQIKCWVMLSFVAHIRSLTTVCTYTITSQSIHCQLNCSFVHTTSPYTFLASWLKEHSENRNINRFHFVLLLHFSLVLLACSLSGIQEEGKHQMISNE